MRKRENRETCMTAAILGRGIRWNSQSKEEADRSGHENKESMWMVRSCVYEVWREIGRGGWQEEEKGRMKA
jgi:hypothetical protein